MTSTYRCAICPFECSLGYTLMGHLAQGHDFDKDTIKKCREVTERNVTPDNRRIERALYSIVNRRVARRETEFVGPEDDVFWNAGLVTVPDEPEQPVKARPVPTGPLCQTRARAVVRKVNPVKSEKPVPLRLFDPDDPALAGV